MKTDTSNPLTTALGIALGVLLISICAAWYEDNKKEEVLEQQRLLETQISEYDSLKQRWSAEASQSVYEYLKSHPNLVKHVKRGGKSEMEFDHLSADDFDTLSNKILNSMLMIKKLTMQRADGAQGRIVVEFES